MGLLDSFAAGYKRGEGRRYLGEKNYEKALERYQSSLKIDPNNRQAFRGMGLAYNGKGEYRLALDYFTKALHIKPTDYKSLRGKGLAHMGLKEYETALNFFNRSLEIKNNDYKAIGAKAASLLALNDHYGSIDWYNKALNLRPKKEYLIKETLNCYDQTLNIYPEDLNLLRGKAVILVGIDDYKSAILCYDKILEIKNDDVEVSFSKIEAMNHIISDFYNNGNYEKALDFIDKAITFCNSIGGNIDVEASRRQLLSMRDMVLENQGKEFDANGNYDNALKCYNTVLSDDPNSIGALRGKGNILWAKYDLKGASICFDKILSIDPEDYEALRFKTETLSLLNNSQKFKDDNISKSYQTTQNYINSNNSTKDLLDINKASQFDIALLPGVGPILASKIIDIRDSQGGLSRSMNFVLNLT